MAVFGVDHPLAMRETVTIEELQPYPMVLIDLPVSADYFMAFFSKIGCKPIIAERTRDMAVMRSMVGSGFGYSIANLRPMTNQSPDGKELRFVPLGGDAKPLQLGLLTGGPARNSAMVRAFVDHCKEQTRQGVLPALLGLG
jgi:DNA-binding transcriptional LysR family regulator